MSLTLQQISHRYGELQVLDAVDFVVAPGQVHALLGENGAGKSTLMHVAYGMLRPDAGTILVADSAGSHRFPRGFASPAEARRVGIGMVHQHFTSIGSFTVAENIALAAGWPESGAAAQRRAEALIARVGLPLDVRVKADSLSVSARQRLEIVKALASDTRILLLDEPTAVLAPREVIELHRAVRSFAESGGAVVLITHKLPEALAMADWVTVLRRGRVVMNGAVDPGMAGSLARAMLGEEQAAANSTRVLQPQSAVPPGEVLVRAERLRLARRGKHESGDAIHDASFTCHAGEIIGVVALEGNGQRELLRAIAGIDGVLQRSGTLDVVGPVAFVPEDRTTEALIPSFTLAENLLLGTLGTHRWIDWRRVNAQTATVLNDFDVRAPGPSTLAGELSGGNQQKLVFGRALAGMPRVLVAEQPTRGLDIRATAAIHDRLREAANSRMAVVVHAADLDEVMAIADRILVVANGQVTMMPPGSSRDVIGDAMLGLGATP